jgi:XTP/dITP diphosphohydrolase
VTSTGRPTGQPLLDFLEDMRRLRRECPWKREQTHRSLARYLQEETAETVEAIDAGDPAHLCEELGDLLLQVYFHAVIAEESGAFSLDDVARGISDKMHRRNPHVFGPDGGPTELTAAEVDAQWQEIKAEERLDRLHDGEPSAYDGIAGGLPALLLATKILERVPDARAGPPEAGDAAAELGDRLLALVAEATAGGLDPEQALREAVRRAVSPGR